jgi:hypothetical protein
VARINKLETGPAGLNPTVRVHGLLAQLYA